MVQLLRKKLLPISFRKMTRTRPQPPQPRLPLDPQMTLATPNVPRDRFNLPLSRLHAHVRRRDKDQLGPSSRKAPLRSTTNRA